MKKKLLALTVFAAVLVGCEKDEPKNEWYIPSDQAVVIGVGDSSRTSIDGDDNVTWNAGDKLGLFCAQTECANVEVTIPESGLSEDRKSATVATSVYFNENAGTHTFYAYYPYRQLSNPTNGQTTLTGLNLSRTQDGDISKTTITWGTADCSKNASTGLWDRLSVKLVTPFAYVRFCFKDTSAEAAYAGKTVTSVTLTAVKGEAKGDNTYDNIQNDASAVFAGRYNVDMTVPATEKGAVTFTTTYSEIAVTPAGCVVGDGSYAANSGYDKNQGALIHINSADFAGEGKLFRISVQFSDGTVGVCYKTAKEFLANHIYNYGINVANLIFNSETTIYVEPWEELSSEVVFD